MVLVLAIGQPASAMTASTSIYHCASKKTLKFMYWAATGHSNYETCKVKELTLLGEAHATNENGTKCVFAVCYKPLSDREPHIWQYIYIQSGRTILLTKIWKEGVTFSAQYQAFICFSVYCCFLNPYWRNTLRALKRRSTASNCCSSTQHPHILLFSILARRFLSSIPPK